MKATLYTFFLLTLFFKVAAQSAPEWVSYYGNDSLISYTTTCMAVDTSGNIYLSGYSLDTSNNRTGIILKYNNAGVLLWSAAFPQDVGSNTKLTIDKQGNILVCMVVLDSLTDPEIRTMKCNPQGDTLWTRTFEGTAFGINYPNAITVDDSSNVYVTGKVTIDTIANVTGGFVTIKYNTIGDEQWVSEYLTEYYADEATAVAVDSIGNVYVVGHVQDTLGYKMVTVKYDPAGVQQWARKYNNGIGDFVKIFDNRYIYSGGELNSFNGWSDFLLIKYDLSGNQIWIDTFNSNNFTNQGWLGYNEPCDMKVDRSGNVYIGGSCNSYTGEMSCATVKFSPSGAVEWAGFYNGGGDGWNNINALAIDKSGNVFATGYSSDTAADEGNLMTTIIYDSSGSQISMLRSFTLELIGIEYGGITIDSTGDIYIATTTTPAGYTDATVVKYGSVSAIKTIADYEGAQFTLYPNPTTNLLNIKPPGNITGYNAEITNLLGQTIYKGYPNNNTIDVSGLAAGIYLLKLQVNGVWGAAKFVKQ